MTEQYLVSSETFDDSEFTDLRPAQLEFLHRVMEEDVGTEVYLSKLTSKGWQVIRSAKILGDWS